MANRLLLPLFAVACFALSFLSVQAPPPASGPRGEKREDNAQEMFDWWYSQRALPHAYIPAGAFQKAVLSARTRIGKDRRPGGRGELTSAASGEGWVSLGPNNVGGRVLSLAVDPHDSLVVWAGSASGGLWKSSTGGEGEAAWSYVNTGFNALSVSTIAIDPSDPARIYIGTGEISYYHSGMLGTPGARSSYGIGVLRSTDGGSSWSQTDLLWTRPQVTAVEKIIINPLNTSTLFAATSEGIYKSIDAGAHWANVFLDSMAMDIVMNPDDTAMVISAHGNLNSTGGAGIFRSTDAGASWHHMTAGLPASNFGRTSLAVSPSASFVVYAGISDAGSSRLLGLYQSYDYGVSWTLVNTTNYVSRQGWYDNVIAASPTDYDSLYCAGLDIYLSANGGDSLFQKTYWWQGYMGSVPTGGPEGSDTYAHADHHAIAFNPLNPGTVYFGCDGGVFKTTDGGKTFSGCNGGLVVSQFYNGFACSPYDSTVAIGGLQDNGVLKYTGTTRWNKSDGGDGGWNAINSANQNIMYDEYTYLTISRSTNGGGSWQPLGGGLINGSGNANFIAPFAISYSAPSVLYAGARIVYKTTDGGTTWYPTNGGLPLNGTKSSAISVSYTSPDTLMAATGSSASERPVFGVFVSTNGGGSWQDVSAGLPTRYPTDIEFDPTDSRISYVTFSGYDSSGGHLFRTTDLGHTWANISPPVNIPHQSVAVDPLDPAQVYVGTDLGVFHSSNAGLSWEDFNSGMVPAMVLDLGVSRSNKALRAATFGNGVYQRRLLHPPAAAIVRPNGGEFYGGGETIAIEWSQKFFSSARLDYSLDNGATWNLIATDLPSSALSHLWTLPDTSTTAGRVRISDAASGEQLDQSDAPFTIIRDANIYAGWNMLSLPFGVSNRQVKALFPSAVSAAFGYSGSYVARDTLQPGAGYWLKFPAPERILYSGDSLLADTIALDAGWNLIGSLSKPVPVASVASIPPGILSSPFFGFSFSYALADTLEPGRGYWIKTGSPGLLVLDAHALPAAAAPSRAWNASAVQAAAAAGSSLGFRDAAGRRQSLYFSMEERSFRIFEPPPLPPEGIFDVRFATEPSAGVAVPAGERAPIQLRGASYPLTISWDIPDGLGAGGGRHAALRAGERSVPLSGRGSMILSGPAGILALEEATGTPGAFSLSQNYPNPFNPSTEIGFRMAGAGTASLVVYDILGKEVAAIFKDEVLAQGEYRRTWNATGFAAGVYFYRLTVRPVAAQATQPAGNGGGAGRQPVSQREEWSETRKMLLIR